MIKTHTERIYCSKFWKKFINIEKIWIQIEFYTNTEKEGILNENELDLHDDITFTLHDKEYPFLIKEIFDLCPELVYKNGKKINGINLFSRIKDKNE